MKFDVRDFHIILWSILSFMKIVAGKGAICYVSSANGINRIYVYILSNTAIIFLLCKYS